jgi:4-hydroxybenzoate polyprenyltransferase
MSRADMMRPRQASTWSWPVAARLVRLSNQTGTLLLLLPTLWSLVLATAGRPPVHLLVVFVMGAFVMRSAGVILNDLADRRFDREVARTRDRPLASGEIAPPQALAIAGALVALAAALVLTLNGLTMALSPVALLLAVLYPFAKRFVHVPQAMLGVSFGWGTVLAWTAARNSMDLPMWWLFAATICWAIAYDTIYALQDREDDLRIGVKSSAILFGRSTWLGVGLALTGMGFCLVAAGRLVQAGNGFYLMLAIVGVWGIRQVVRLATRVSPETAFALFKEHIWIGALILIGCLAGFV